VTVEEIVEAEALWTLNTLLKVDPHKVALSSSFLAPHPPTPSPRFYYFRPAEDKGSAGAL